MDVKGEGSNATVRLSEEKGGGKSKGQGEKDWSWRDVEGILGWRAVDIILQDTVFGERGEGGRCFVA